VYIAYTQAPPDMLGQMFVKVRTTGAPSATMPTIQREIRHVAPGLTAAWSETVSAGIANESHAEASLASLVTAAGAIALFLAMVGLYGTMAQAVMRRTREIGLRMALGARAHEVSGMILRDAGKLVLAGIIIGVPAAWASARVVQGFLFGVGPANLFTTVFCCVLVLTVSLAAGLVPALRAARVDPLRALQQD
jgi:ABC-type antimicrobial peptide transport system permease subunit